MAFAKYFSGKKDAPKGVDPKKKMAPDNKPPRKTLGQRIAESE